jgi:exosortase D (VPLPA-CTERM-specific)
MSRFLPVFMGVLYCVLFLGLFFSPFKVMVSSWRGDDYTYCYFVPLVILYLLWERRKRLAAIPSCPTWTGLVPFGLGVMLYWVGELGGEYYTLYFSSWVILVGLCWTHLGWRKLKQLGFAFVLLLSMLPLPDFIYKNLSLQLQLISSRLGTALIQFYGIPVHREGNVIDLGIAQLQIVDACNGLRYLMPLVVLGLILACFFRASFWKRALLVFSTVPLAIGINSVRIALTGLLSVKWGSHVIDGFSHDFAGWAMFMASLAILLGEMRILKKLGIDGFRACPRSPALRGIGRGNLGIDITRNPELATRNRLSLFTLHSSLFTILIATLALINFVDFREKTPIKKPFSQLPLKIGEWQGTPRQMDAEELKSLRFSDYSMVSFRRVNGDVVDFYIAYYASQRKGESIHSPETCLPGHGWVFNESGAVVLPVSGSASAPVCVSRAFIQQAGERELTYYWFPTRGRILTSLWRLKLYNFWDAITMRRTDGAIVRLITPVGQYEDVESADRRLQNFTRQLWPVLGEFLPE